MVKLEIQSDKENVTETIKSAIDSEISRLKISLQKTDSEILKFEAKYKISSKDFVKNCSAEDLEDDEEFISWTGEIRIREKLLEELGKLTEIEYVSH